MVFITIGVHNNESTTNNLYTNSQYLLIGSTRFDVYYVTI
jgi:hypothetical protein